MTRDEYDELQTFHAALQHAGAIVVTVPAESMQEQHEIAELAHAWNRANGSPITQTMRGWGVCRDVTPPGHPYGVAEVDELFIAWRFSMDVDADALLAFASLVTPFAWPDRPTMRLEPKGADA